MLSCARQSACWTVLALGPAALQCRSVWRVLAPALDLVLERAMPKPVARIGRHSRLPDMSEAQPIVTLILDAVRNHDPVHYRSLETTR